MAPASYLVANPNDDLIVVSVEQGVVVCQDHVRLLFPRSPVCLGFFLPVGDLRKARIKNREVPKIATAEVSTHYKNKL
jgi:hypothetical protein